MCAIIGALVWGLTTPEARSQANSLLNHIVAHSHKRGRDGRGFLTNYGDDIVIEKSTDRKDAKDWAPVEFFKGDVSSATFISNLRAEPTTEYVADKSQDDQQPYSAGHWSIVHNGTIANDKALRTGKVPTRIDSAAIAEVLDANPCDGSNAYRTALHFIEGVKRLKGSYAILATHSEQKNHLLVAANYRPIWFVVTEVGVFFASARHYFPDNMTPRMVDPYSVMSFYFSDHLEIRGESLYDVGARSKALVVCSGGLDSVVAATYVKKVIGVETELIHFCYGSRAEGPEVIAVQAAADALGVPCTVFPLPVYKPSDSPLLQADSKIAGGEEGAEFAHEWVPARNLLLLSVATAYAEANGFDTIVLGNNLEEAGAYPDNEPEFIAKFNDLLPFAVGDGKRMRVMMPVGNLMKHEIVALGHRIGAPLDKTWSCYRAGEQHCGTCGPCYMRRTAFDINGLEEVISYSNDKE
jgi:7-cyano-7-deazaguanine synthase